MISTIASSFIAIGIMVVGDGKLYWGGCIGGDVRIICILIVKSLRLLTIVIFNNEVI